MKINWITDDEIVAIRSRIASQRFPGERGNIPQWYARFISLVLGVATGIICFITPEPRWAFLSLLWLVIAYFQHAAWKHFKEQYVLQLELKKTETVEQHGRQISSEGAPSAPPNESSP
jgi:4-hydroxybenzoate polyprenyltransferase